MIPPPPFSCPCLDTSGFQNRPPDQGGHLLLCCAARNLIFTTNRIDAIRILDWTASIRVEGALLVMHNYIVTFSLLLLRLSLTAAYARSKRSR